MATKVVLDGSARDILVEGVNFIADAVSSTLGPGGKIAMIADPKGGMPNATKDGVTVAISIAQHENAQINMGMQLIKGIAMETWQETGDGTTTATVLGRSMIVNGNKNLALGHNATEMCNGINKAVDIVVDYIKTNARPANNEELLNIATIASNNDNNIGALVSECISYVGAEGVVSVHKAQGRESYIEKKAGMLLETSVCNRSLLRDAETMSTTLDNAYVLIYDRKISELFPIEHILQNIYKSKRDLLIICEDMDGQAMTTILVNIKSEAKVCVIKTPGFNNRADVLEDIAAFTGTKVISEESGMGLKHVKMEDLGFIHKSVTKERISVLIEKEGCAKNENVITRLLQIKSQITFCTNPHIKESMRQRYATLAQAHAIFYVAQKSELDCKEQMARIDDSIRATKAAIEEGVIPGGGYSYNAAANVILDMLDKTGPDNMSESEIFGHVLVVTAIKDHFIQLCQNADLDAKKIHQKVCASNMLFNVKTSDYEDPATSKVIDPAKVLRAALQKAASAACMFIPTKCIIS